MIINTKGQKVRTTNRTEELEKVGIKGGFPFITEGWVLGLVLGWVLGGVLGLVFVFCIPFTQRHFRKIGVGLSKNCTSTPLKGDEPRAQGQRGRSGRPTNRQLHNHKVPLYASKYRTYFPKYMT